MTAPKPIPFKGDWPEPAPFLIRPILPPAPELPLEDVVGPTLARWTRQAAGAKGAPPDYVFASLLVVAGATLGNARWVSPYKGWTEPPILWAICIGLPSAGKSPAIDAVLKPLREVEKPLRQEAQKKMEAWAEKHDTAKMIEQIWRSEAQKAMKAGKEPPAKPESSDAGPPPHIPRLVVNDATIERWAELLNNQPRGILQFRDEMAGWLEGMNRYSAASDRAFWLEAYGGRFYSVERMGRPSLTVNMLGIGVLGGIQPDRLKSLLFQSDNDGLLARFLPIWPEPVPIQPPKDWNNAELLEGVLEKLLTLKMEGEGGDNPRPWFVNFTDEAVALMTEFRRSVKAWEAEAEGLLISFIGKLPGLAARLALVLAHLDWAAGDAEQPERIGEAEFGKAAHLIEAYILPMAKRAYAEASGNPTERGARNMVHLIREKGWTHFSSRQVLKLGRTGLAKADELNPVLNLLEDGDCIRLIEPDAQPKGGRPTKRYTVNPALHRRPR